VTFLPEARRVPFPCMTVRPGLRPERIASSMNLSDEREGFISRHPPDVEVLAHRCGLLPSPDSPACAMRERGRFPRPGAGSRGSRASGGRRTPQSRFFPVGGNGDNLADIAPPRHGDGTPLNACSPRGFQRLPRGQSRYGSPASISRVIRETVPRGRAARSPFQPFVSRISLMLFFGSPHWPLRRSGPASSIGLPVSGPSPLRSDGRASPCTPAPEPRRRSFFLPCGFQLQARLLRPPIPARLIRAVKPGVLV